MEKTKNRSFKKKTSTIAVILTAIALLLAGTYAWYDFSQSAVNEFSGEKAAKPSVELIDDFDPDDVVPGANVNKDVYVKNTGNTDVFVRIKLQEYMDLTSTTPGTDWTTHIPGSSLIDCSEDFHDYFEWVLGNKVISMAEYKAKSAADRLAYVGWVYDTDGYAYWSQPLAAGTQTDLLLDAIKVSSALEDYDFYYAINVIMEAVDIDDLPMWTVASGNNDGKGQPSVVDGSKTDEASNNAKDLLNSIGGGESITGTIKTLQVGDTFTTSVDGYTDVEWIVLETADENDGHVLILAKDTLKNTAGTNITRAYKSANPYAAWDTLTTSNSPLKAELATFTSKLPTELQACAVVANTPVENDGSPFPADFEALQVVTSARSTYTATANGVAFPLSIGEYNYYRQTGKGMAIASALSTSRTWWLRSPGLNTTDNAARVFTDGTIWGNLTVTDPHGVRPALWLNLGA